MRTRRRRAPGHQADEHPVRSGRQPSVGDFGLAQMLEGNPVITRTGTVLGTPSLHGAGTGAWEKRRSSLRYLQSWHRRLRDAGRDAPFTDDSPLAVLLKHVNEPLPVSAAGRLPAPVVRAIQKAAAKDPAERWASAGQFVDALEQGFAVAAPARASGDAWSITAAAVLGAVDRGRGGRNLDAREPQAALRGTLQAASRCPAGRSWRWSRDQRASPGVHAERRPKPPANGQYDEDIRVTRCRPAGRSQSSSLQPVAPEEAPPTPPATPPPANEPELSRSCRQAERAAVPPPPASAVHRGRQWWCSRLDESPRRHRSTRIWRRRRGSGQRRSAGHRQRRRQRGQR